MVKVYGRNLMVGEHGAHQVRLLDLLQGGPVEVGVNVIKESPPVVPLGHFLLSADGCQKAPGAVFRTDPVGVITFSLGGVFQVILCLGGAPMRAADLGSAGKSHHHGKRE
jgi:hypothetical protein